MEDLLQEKKTSLPNNNNNNKRPVVQNRRLLSFATGLCGEDGSQCPDAEFVVVGTGESIFGRDLPELNKHHHNTDLAVDASSLSPLSKWWKRGAAAMGVSLSLLTILMAGFLYKFKLRPAALSAEKGSKEHKTKNAGDDKPTNDSPAGLTETTGGLQGMAEDSHSTPNTEEEEDKLETRAMFNAQGTTIVMKEEGNNQALSSSSVISKDQLKESGQQVARSLSVIMSEFESTMKQQGYKTLSQSDCLAVASQQLSRMELERTAREAEVRHYLYDAQQRTVDRSLAEQWHSQSLDAQEHDKDWFPKLVAARGTCTQAIFPSVQKSCVATVLSWIVYHFWQHRDTLSNPTSIVTQKVAEMLFQVDSGDHEIFMNSQGAGSTTTASSAFPGTWFAFPYLILLLSRIWMFVILPLMALGFLLALNMCLPIASGILQQLIRILLAAVFLGWTLSSTTFPWKNVLVGQVIFCVMAHLGSQVLFARSLRQLQGQSSPICCKPSSQELAVHLYTFDSMARSMVGCSCAVNLAILVAWSCPAGNNN